MDQREKQQEMRQQEKLPHLCPKCDEEFKTASRRWRINCPLCDTKIVVYRARLSYLATVEAVRKLSSGPKEASEFYQWPRIAERLSVAGHSKGSKKARGSTTSVYYLPGQERQAVTLFIEANEEYVKSIMGDESNPINGNWPEELYNLLLEQWYWQFRSD